MHTSELALSQYVQKRKLIATNRRYRIIRAQKVIESIDSEMNREADYDKKRQNYRTNIHTKRNKKGLRGKTTCRKKKY